MEHAGMRGHSGAAPVTSLEVAKGGKLQLWGAAWGAALCAESSDPALLSTSMLTAAEVTACCAGDHGRL